MFKIQKRSILNTRMILLLLGTMVLFFILAVKFNFDDAPFYLLLVSALWVGCLVVIMNLWITKRELSNSHVILRFLMQEGQLCDFLQTYESRLKCRCGEIEANSQASGGFSEAGLHQVKLLMEERKEFYSAVYWVFNYREDEGDDGWGKLPFLVENPAQANS